MPGLRKNFNLDSELSVQFIVSKQMRKSGDECSAATHSFLRIGSASWRRGFYGALCTQINLCALLELGRSIPAGQTVSCSWAYYTKVWWFCL